MENNVSSDNVISSFYKRYGTKLISDGSDDVIVDRLNNYDDFTLSLIKCQLIHNITKDFSKELKLKRFFSEASIADILKGFKEYVPDPWNKKGNNKKWTDNDKLQINTCCVLKKILNKHMSKNIINENEDPSWLCKDVSEIIHSLFIGFHTEFNLVHHSIEHILSNMKLLVKVLNEQGKHLEIKLTDDDNLYAWSKIKLLCEIHEDVIEELNCQLILLNNMLDVIIKLINNDLEKLLNNNKELKSFVHKIKSIPGDDKFACKISYTLTGLQNVAEAANLIDKVLKKIGLLIENYKDLNDSQMLKDKFAKITEINLNKSEVDLTDLKKSKNVLMVLNYFHKNIVDYFLANKKTGTAEIKLEKKIKLCEDLKNALLKTFAIRLNLVFDGILKMTKLIGKLISVDTIKLSDQLIKFLHTLELFFNKIQKNNIYYTLSGYLNDIRSRKDCKTFLASTKYVISVLDEIFKSNEYKSNQQFNDLKCSFEEIVEIIIDFSNKFTTNFASVGNIATSASKN